MARKAQKKKIKPLQILSLLIFLIFGFFSIYEIEENKKITVNTNVPFALENFSQAKRVARELFSDRRETFYCGCKFDQHNNIDLKSCGYKIQQDKKRAERLEWEHIVPVSHLASHLNCWKNPICCKNGECVRGRRCCQEIDANFSKMEADLHNLVPEVGELNALRSNYRYGILPDVSKGRFGQCEIKIDPETKRVEPRPEIRGMIARTYLYMSDTYHFHLSDSQRQLFLAWNKQYPPSDAEFEWNERVFRVQGNHNSYIVNAREGRKYNYGSTQLYNE